MLQSDDDDDDEQPVTSTPGGKSPSTDRAQQANGSVVVEDCEEVVDPCEADNGEKAAEDVGGVCRSIGGGNGPGGKVRWCVALGKVAGTLVHMQLIF